MSKYLVAKKDELKAEFNEQGLACVEVCPGASPYLKVYKYVLMESIDPFNAEKRNISVINRFL